MTPRHTIPTLSSSNHRYKQVQLSGDTTHRFSTAYRTDRVQWQDVDCIPGTAQRKIHIETVSRRREKQGSYLRLVLLKNEVKSGINRIVNGDGGV